MRNGTVYRGADDETAANVFAVILLLIIVAVVFGPVYLADRAIIERLDVHWAWFIPIGIGLYSLWGSFLLVFGIGMSLLIQGILYPASVIFRRRGTGGRGYVR